MTSSAEPAIDIMSAGAVKTLLAELARAFLDRDGSRSRLTRSTPRPRSPAASRMASATTWLWHRLPCFPPSRNPADWPWRARPLWHGSASGWSGRAGQDAPDISTQSAITVALLEAAAIVINQASTGLYLEKLLGRLGIFERCRGQADPPADRTRRDGRGWRRRRPDYIGFGAVTEIEVHKALGVHLAALLPEELQNYTNYEAASSAGPQAHPAADRFIAFIGSPDSDACFMASGLERPVPAHASCASRGSRHRRRDRARYGSTLRPEAWIRAGAVPRSAAIEREDVEARIAVEQIERGPARQYRRRCSAGRSARPGSRE